ncbi:response regulator [Ponticaulis sp.]|uniref:response regulator n=1 Tax=Ponticaulis sp. TaxID=2020902 RepID=UPI000C67A9E5|nr:response regulator [Ponticaulis sp.]MAJ10029.1 response regulator [Ponticaulis sp.]MBN03681.1 response regulator [Ponticaulis sp.]MDF1680507.1 response regulator [Ponticaulis sp.]HBJ92169.1 response regulator [Hyphomonadaceae bacterium]|tara:strand:+ start:12105 stop:12482 length:378 start_codon:yes stop_codon:yes gene_type:complete
MKILFVEDDAMNRRVVKEMLTAARIEMHEAEDAPTGLKMIDEGDYDLILMDLRMPGMDGMEAIGHIRARDDEKGKLPIIVVTADTALNLRGQCLEQGADEFLIKPVEVRALFETIAYTIAKRKKA